jgi:hypothetical protein
LISRLSAIALQHHGRGIWRDVDGSVYDGEWIDGLKEGRGTFRWSDGSSYSGTWLADKMHGQGIYASSDGSQKYIGAWEFGLRQGQGVLSDALGTYEGEWRNDKVRVCVLRSWRLLRNNRVAVCCSLV